jgi:hypothetical protein
VLAVSAPSKQTGPIAEQYGAVYFYDLAQLSGELTLDKAKYLLVLEGDDHFARFGHKVLFDTYSSSWWISQPRRASNGPESGALFQWDR